MNLANRSEEYFKNYLKKISKEELLQFYEDLEWTPFPVLVIEEYQRRLKPKNRDVFEKLEAEKILARIRTNELRSLAKKGTQWSKSLRNSTSKRISSGISSARKLTYSSDVDLMVLERLGDLNRQGIITKKEFEDKKQEILKRI